MRSWLMRAVWASVLGMGVAAGLARGADDPLRVVVPPGPDLFPAPHPGAGPAAVPPLTLPYYDPDSLEPPPGKWPRFRQWLRKPIGCWTHHNTPACGSLRSELTFAFGSCRAFYGEPCVKTPPPWPFPPNPAPGPGCNTCP